MAKAAKNHTPPPDLPQLVPLEAALNFLHDGDPAALAAPLTERHYNRRTLDSLRDCLSRTGARVRGQIDNDPPRWIESVELLDYILEYEMFLVPGGWKGIITPVSKLTYFAEQTKDRDFPVRFPGSPEPKYRRALRNATVETALLLKLWPRGGRGSAGWIMEELARMRTKGEVSADTRITSLARELEQRMHRAARADDSIRPIKQRSIANMLRNLRLFPIK
jgi:hypothetical protein